MRPAAGRHEIGIAGPDAHRIVRDAQKRADQLREGRPMALAGVLRPNHDVDRFPAPVDDDFGTLARHAARAFDVIAEPDAATAPARARLDPALLEPVPVGEIERALHNLIIGAVVVGHAERIAVGLFGGADHVAPPQFDPVEAALARRQIDHAFDGIHRLRSASAAIGNRRRSIGHHRARRDPCDRHAVEACHQLRALVERHVGDGVRADIGDVCRAEREEIAGGVERQLRVDLEVAALVVGQEGIRCGPPRA